MSLASEFKGEFNRRQSDVWGGAPTEFKRYVVPASYKALWLSSTVEAPFSVPAVENPSSFDSGTQELIKKLRVEIDSGQSFVIKLEKNFPGGRGWKTFLLYLRKIAPKHTVLHGVGAMATVTYYEDGKFNVEDDVTLGNDGFEGASFDFVDNKHIDKFVIEENGLGRHDVPMILIATEEELQGFEERGILSKIQRMAVNKHQPLEEYQFVGADWKEIIRQRIENTVVDLDWLTVGDKDTGLSNKFQICQKIQRESVERLLKIVMNIFHARTLSVLSGGYGVGKSVILERVFQLLKIVNGGMLPMERFSDWDGLIGEVSREGECDTDKNIHVNYHERSEGGHPFVLFRSDTAEKFPDVVFLDDAAEKPFYPSLTNWTDTYRAGLMSVMALRPGILGATNMDYSKLSKYMENLLARVSLPINPEVIEFPGEDYHPRRKK